MGFLGPKGDLSEWSGEGSNMSPEGDVLKTH